MDSLGQSLQPAAGPRKARIEIIPLIDVIFFLLATFVLFTLSLTRIQSVPVDLPLASSQASALADEDQVTIQVTENDQAYWNRELISLAAIPARLASHRLGSPSPKILVTGDDSASYGDVVRVLDQTRAAGITLVSLETAPRATGR